MFSELKDIRLSKKSVTSLSFFFIFIFSLGLWAGSAIPHSRFDSVFEYAVLLEKENSKIYKKV